MMKKTLIATATAGLIAAGAMVATTGTASAAGIYFGGPGWSVGISDGHGWRGHRRPHRVCKPVFKTVRWWDRWGRPHFKQVVVGQECHWAMAGALARGRRGWDHGPNPAGAIGAGAARPITVHRKSPAAAAAGLFACVRLPRRRLRRPSPTGRP